MGLQEEIVALRQSIRLLLSLIPEWQAEYGGEQGRLGASYMGDYCQLCRGMRPDHKDSCFRKRF